MKVAIHSVEAPAAIGPYSQAIKAGQWVFLSGQIPLHYQTGKLVEGGVAAQTEQVMQNLAAVLRAAGCTFSHVVRTTIYLTDLGNFTDVNEVYARYFPEVPPARATVQVSALPRGAHVEIDAIAMAPSA